MTSARKSSSRCILVLGMHRSGTSVLARALIALGVDFGNQLLAGRADNPKGFFEDAEAHAINEAFLKNLGCSWHSLVLPQNIADELTKAYQDDIRNKILAKFLNMPLWGLKEPRITRLLNHWQVVLQEAGVNTVYLLANRHPFSVADSLSRRNKLPMAQSLALWAIHQLNGLEALAAYGGLVVEYDQLLLSPKKELDRLAGFLEIPIEDRQAEVDIFISLFLQADLRHAQYTEQINASTNLQALCLEIYRQTRALATLSGGVTNGLKDLLLKVIRENREQLESMKDWMIALDVLHAAQTEQRKLFVMERNKALDQLKWLESRLPIRLYNRIKDKLQAYFGRNY